MTNEHVVADVTEHQQLKINHMLSKQQTESLLRSVFAPPNVANNLREGSWDDPQVNPNEILLNMLDHIHDGNREELVGQMILMLGWLHKGGTMPNISKDTITSTTVWTITDDN